MTIEIRGLSKRYADGKVALTGLDLDVDDGMMGLLGPNGAGKTTFLSILTLALEPTSGTRRYDGLDASRAASRPEIRRRIGYLPQDFAPIRHLTGLEYVVHCARLRMPDVAVREVERRAHELLDAVALTHASHRPSGDYSGGMRRRLGIAQALIHRPRLVVVDEPTAGLDPEERIRFRNLIADAAEGTAVLLSTHIVEDVEATCPRLAVIAQGRLLFDGPPTELFALTADDSPASSAGFPDREGAAECVEPTLEQAYGSFLARHGSESTRQGEGRGVG